MRAESRADMYGSWGKQQSSRQKGWRRGIAGEASRLKMTALFGNGLPFPNFIYLCGALQNCAAQFNQLAFVRFDGKDRSLNRRRFFAIRVSQSLGEYIGRVPAPRKQDYARASVFKEQGYFTASHPILQLGQPSFNVAVQLHGRLSGAPVAGNVGAPLQFSQTSFVILDLNGLDGVVQDAIGSPNFRRRRRGRIQHDFP